MEKNYEYEHGKIHQHLINIDQIMLEIKDGQKTHNASDLIAFKGINDKLDAIKSKVAYGKGFLSGVSAVGGVVGGVIVFVAQSTYSKYYG